MLLYEGRGYELSQNIVFFYINKNQYICLFVHKQFWQNSLKHWWVWPFRFSKYGLKIQVPDALWVYR